MKQRKVSGFLILALAFMIGFLLPVKEADAGQSITMLDAGSIQDVARWYCPNGDVLMDNGVLTFTKESNGDTKFISRIAIEANQDNPEFLVFECNVKLTQLPQGEKFVLGLGLKRIETSMGDADNVEITFINDGEIKVGVYAYAEEGEPVTVIEPKACGISIGQTMSIRASLTGEKMLELMVQGRTICSKELPVTGSGRVGFLQTGNCAAEVTNINLRGYKYERPENTNISEDFEDGVDVSRIDIVNTTDAGVKLNKPARVVVEEYEKGKSALMFVNAPGYYVTTQYQYSNFEMTFDVPYLKLKKDVYRDDGEGYFYSFGILYGMASNASAKWDSTDAIDGILFDLQGNVTSAKKEAFSTVLESHRFWEEFKPFSVKLSVVDGVVTVGIKWVEEKQFTTIGSYKLATGSPTGYIRFSIPTLGSGSIDNLKITNLDEKPRLIETEYQNGIVTVEDAAYEPFERVYGEKTSTDDTKVVNMQNKKLLAWYWLLPEAVVIGGVIIGLTVVQNKRKKKNVKEEKVNET